MVVREVDSNLAAKEIKEAMVKEMGNKVDARVKVLKEVKSGVVIETVTKSERDALRKSEEFGKLGLKVEVPNGLTPKLLIFDVPREWKDDFLLEQLYLKNMRHRANNEEWKEKVKDLKRQGSGSLVNVLLEMPKNWRNELARRKRAYAEFRSFRVKEFDTAWRCFRCNDLGHLIKNCPKKERYCRKCFR